MNKNKQSDTGKYTYKMDAICICGHSLGIHDAEHTEGKQYCQNMNPVFGDGEDCDCEEFNLARK